MISLTANQQFELDLEDSGRSYEVILKTDVARELLAACHHKLQQLGKQHYKKARNEALEDALLVGGIVAAEWNAYKDFIDRRFQRRARKAISLKYRPFAPLLEDGP